MAEMKSLNGNTFVDETSRNGVTNVNRRIDYLLGGFDDGEQEAVKKYIDEKCGGNGGGANGVTPHIGENDNWYIGDEDTGVSAAGAYVTRLDEMGGDATKTTYRMVFSDGKGYDFDVYHGDKGDKGDPYTLTETDKALIVASVIESLGGNPIFGYVDENNNIIVQGNLTDGTYSVKYEMADGSTVDIGNLVHGTNTYYITKNLTNCAINNNSATQVVEGGSYSATISANDGYELSSVVVTMGGNAVSVSGGVINITSVTGNIVITATATVIETGTNNLLDEAGYKSGYRIKLSTGKEEAIAGVCCSGYMPINYGDTLYIKNITLHSTADYNAIVFYDNDGNLITGCATNFTITTQSNGVYSLYVHSNKLTAFNSNIKKFRFGCASITDDTIVTVNDPL